MELIAQLVGFVGLAANVSSLQFKDRQKLLLLNLIACVFMALHFLLMGAYTAAGMFFIAIFRVLLFRRFEGEGRPRWPLYLMLACFLVTGALTWQSPLSALPLISTMFVTTGLWQNDTQRTRQLVMFGPVLWMGHNIAIGSIAGVANEALSLVSVLVGLWRHRKAKSISDSGEVI